MRLSYTVPALVSEFVEWALKITVTSHPLSFPYFLKVLEEEMKNVLYTDSAVTGEASGVSIGFIMAGSGNSDSLTDIITYAGET